VATNDERFLVVAGTDPTGAARIARYDATTGALDPSFGNDGSLRVLLARVEAETARSGSDQLYLGGLDAQNRPAVTRVWNQVEG
jgi:hypothetical protein